MMINEIEKLPQVFHPWRRYLARTMDCIIYNLLWLTFIAFIFHVNVAARRGLENVLDSFITLVIMLGLEPLLLHLFKTTPGKAIFGLRIENCDGSKLSYGEALERTWRVIGEGMGYNIPIYRLVRLWKSYNLCSENETLPWDESISYTIKDTKWYRGVFYVCAFVCSFVVVYAIISAQLLPPNKGDLTIAEFAENYNYYAKHFDMSFRDEYLDENGKWKKKESDSMVIYISHNENPEFDFILKNGYITDVSFEIETKNNEYMLSPYDRQMVLASLAFAGAQDEMKLFSKIPNRIIEQIENNTFKDYHFAEAGITFICDIEHSGYYETQSYLLPSDDEKETYFNLKFSMNKQ